MVKMVIIKFKNRILKVAAVVVVIIIIIIIIVILYILSIPK